MEKKGKIFNFVERLKGANLYMAEHLRSTMYFLLLSYRTPINSKIERLLHP
jgi:hypothetical protein